jgi:hypothetical protein
LTISFSICIPFISSSCLIAWVKSSNTMLDQNGESGHSCLIPDYRGNVSSFSPLSMILATGLSYIAFIILKYVPSVPSFIRAFIMKGWWILSKVFLHLLRWSCGFCLCFC